MAAELNQPTTAFIGLEQSGALPLQWFTPTTRLPLCGHATLAAAHVLFSSGRVDRTAPLTFATAAGELAVSARDPLLWLDLPAVTLAPTIPDAAALAAIGLTEDDLADGEAFHASDYECIVIAKDPERVEALRPDIAAIRALAVTRIVVTAAGGPDGANFTSRVFVPSIGLDEDQVTGSAHAVLGPLWAQRSGRTSFAAVQASGRRGRLALTHRGDRVHIGGRAITTARGDLLT